MLLIKRMLELDWWSGNTRKNDSLRKRGTPEPEYLVAVTRLGNSQIESVLGGWSVSDRTKVVRVVRHVIPWSSIKVTIRRERLFFAVSFLFSCRRWVTERILIFLWVFIIVIIIIIFFFFFEKYRSFSLFVGNYLMEELKLFLTLRCTWSTFVTNQTWNRSFICNSVIVPYIILLLGWDYNIINSITHWKYSLLW